jgi:hypothetical protein
MVRNRIQAERNLNTVLQILSVYAFEKMSLAQLLTAPAYTSEGNDIPDQSSLFDS